MRDRRKGGRAKVTLQERHTAPFSALERCCWLSPTSSPATAEEEMLTALLGYSDGNVPAHRLLQRFPSIGHAVAADESQLEKLGLSRRDINLLRLVHTTAQLLAAGAVRARPMVGNTRSLLDYLQTSMAYEQVEQLRMLFLDCRNHIIADEVLHRGTINHTPVQVSNQVAVTPPKCSTAAKRTHFGQIARSRNNRARSARAM